MATAEGQLSLVRPQDSPMNPPVAPDPDESNDESSPASSSGKSTSTPPVSPSIVVPTTTAPQTATTAESANTEKSLPPRKRSKVSRACDQCRRKKIRCNAILNMYTNQVIKVCSNCSKSGEVCTFTRIPLKRGPSKGYTRGRKKSTDQTVGRDPSAAAVHRRAHSVDVHNILSDRPPGPGPFQFASGKKILLPPLDMATAQGKPPSPQSAPQPPSLIPVGVGFPGTFPSLIQSSSSATDPSSVFPLLQRGRSASLNSQPAPPAPPLLKPQQQQQRVANQPIFWKVPYDMPRLTPDRRGSIDSMGSTAGPSSGSVMPSGPSISAIPPVSVMPPRLSRSAQSSRSGSDGEDEYYSASSLQRSGSAASYQGAVSPAASISSLQSITQGVTSLPMPSQMTGSSMGSVGSFSQPPPGTPDVIKSLTYHLDAFYRDIQKKYPILPPKETLQECIHLLDARDYMSVLELFLRALRILNSQEFSASFPEVIRSFEEVTRMYPSESFIGGNRYAETVFTSTLVLLNYIVVLSGRDYSLGFGIAFSIFRDWTVFKDGPESANFQNLIQLMVLDNCHCLYFGTPRSSTLLSSLDEKFADDYLRSLGQGQLSRGSPMGSPRTSPKGNPELEFLKVGIILILLSNSVEQADAVKKLESLEITGHDCKFLSVLKCGAELMQYFHGLSVYEGEQGQIDNFVFETEHEVFKMCKKIINLVDEQLDDFEIFKLQPLLSLMVLKCAKTLRDLAVVLRGMLELNRTLARDILDDKIRKLMESAHNNISRCLNLRLPNQLIKTALVNLASSKAPEIHPVKTSTNKHVDHLSVLKSWCRLTDGFLVSSFSNDSMNGWCS